jgi:hypothetical protein
LSLATHAQTTKNHYHYYFIYYPIHNFVLTNHFEYIVMDKIWDFMTFC